MPSIEYSPNSRASCKGCYCKILKGSVRVAVKSWNEYGRGHDFINKYYHGSCYYAKHKDFTQFFGFHQLDKEDKKKFMSENNLKQFFPEDYIDTDKILSSINNDTETTTTTSGSNDAEGNNNNKRDNDSNIDKKTLKKAKYDKDRELFSQTLSITGLKYSPINASPGQKVKLVPEPDNPYDKKAVRVDNIAGQKIGHIQKEQAAKLSPILLNIISDEKNKKPEQEYTVQIDAKVLNQGDGYKQNCYVKIFTVPMVKNNNTAKATSSSGSNTTTSKENGKNKRGTSNNKDNKNNKSKPKKAKKTQTKQKNKEIFSQTLSITGLKYSSTSASTGQKVKLVPEPNNPYDKNAIRVDTIDGQKIGHLKKEQAAKLSPILLQIENSNNGQEQKTKEQCTGGTVVQVDAEILNQGDGYTQSCHVKIFTTIHPPPPSVVNDTATTTTVATTTAAAATTATTATTTTTAAATTAATTATSRSTIINSGKENGKNNNKRDNNNNNNNNNNKNNNNKSKPKKSKKTKTQKKDKEIPIRVSNNCTKQALNEATEI